VTALAGLETGVIQAGSRFYCSGKFLATSKSRPMKCWWHTGHGSINLYEALERSCNVYFYNVARKVGVEKLAYYARLFGFGAPYSLETGSAAAGLIPDTAWKQKKMKDKWYEGETLNMGIGQGYVQVSPLQALRMTAMIAKDGEMSEPHLIKKAVDPSARKPRLAVKREHLNAIKKGMLQVVHSPYGTGQLAKVDFAKMGAKTGTAQNPPKEPHSWMTGFLPYKKPKLAFVVFVENGGSGGITAGKILKEVLLAAKELNLV
jgi:penicillin-binding protein 2